MLAGRGTFGDSQAEATRTVPRQSVVVPDNGGVALSRRANGQP
jgi:hypothetical protein